MRHVPSTENVIRTLLLLYPDISTDELQVKLAELGITPTKFAVGQCRSSFLAILKLLRGFDLLKDEKPVVPAWLKAARRRNRRERQQPYKSQSHDGGLSGGNQRSRNGTFRAERKVLFCDKRINSSGRETGDMVSLSPGPLPRRRR